MTVPIWPDALPQCFTTTSHEEEGADNVLRSENSIGPAKTRQRTTANVSKESGQMVMSAGQYKAFKSFVKTDLLDGAEAFLFPDQLGGLANLVRIVSPYKASRTGAKWYVSLALEVLP
ncbi:hypothetical protein [Rhizobium sp. BK456]|uniref:hypothetical protein n=1 Tax=Rhizobium sp. BK456 TaxID=2587007 RepID=UPI0016071D92|nr:hypothetical protein [Rhizobium sp. BK456]MBB3523077.1 hypothetical protein [Rhizobium sp. BK456]